MRTKATLYVVTKRAYSSHTTDLSDGNIALKFRCDVFIRMTA